MSLTTFRNVSASPRDPVDTWPFEALVETLGSPSSMRFARAHGERWLAEWSAGSGCLMATPLRASSPSLWGALDSASRMTNATR